MRRNSGNVEPLLLLCCLVGVVAFFCISLASSAVLIDTNAEEKIFEERSRLMTELREKENLARDLARHIEDVETRIREAKRAIDSSRQPQIHMAKLQEEMAVLTKEREDLEKRLETLRRQLTELNIKPDTRKKEDKERELLELTKMIEELEERVRSCKQEVATSSVPEGEKGPGYEAQKRAIQKEIDSAREKAKRTEGRIKESKVRLLMGGESRHKSPLYVECRKDVYVFYPEGETVGVAEIEKKDVLAERFAGHDIVVLIVRPDGYAGFNKAYDKAKQLNIAICYEPLQSDRSLDFLKG